MCISLILKGDNVKKAMKKEIVSMACHSYESLEFPILKILSPYSRPVE